MKLVSFIILSVLFAVMIWVFVMLGAQTLWRQHLAESFPHIQGTVLSSQVTVTHGSKGSIHYHVSIAYDYTVQGRAYESYRYRYDSHPDNQELAHEIVSEHPPGSVLNVYYNPQDPSDAVLSPKVETGDVDILFFLGPVCLIFPWLMARSTRQFNWSSNAEAGGVQLITDMMVTRVRLPRFQPLEAGVVGLGAFSLIAGILMATDTMSGPPLILGGCLLPLVVLGGVFAFGWQFRNVQSGRQDLVIDEAARTFQLPLTYSRKTQTPMPITHIQAVTLKAVRHSTKGGGYFTYVVTLELRDGSSESLVDMKQARAESLAGWLKGKFGLKGETSLLNRNNPRIGF